MQGLGSDRAHSKPARPKKHVTKEVGTLELGRTRPISTKRPCYVFSRLGLTTYSIPATEPTHSWAASRPVYPAIPSLQLLWPGPLDDPDIGV